MANILFSPVTVDVSSSKSSFEEDYLYELVLSHSRQDIRQVRAPLKLHGDLLTTEKALAFDVLNWNLIDSITVDVTKTVTGEVIIMGKKNAPLNQAADVLFSGTIALPLKDIITAKIDAKTIAFEKDYTTEGTHALPVKIRFEFEMND